MSDDEVLDLEIEDNDLEVIENEPAEQIENEDEDEANKITVKPKRVIRNPQPKLNAETLKGKRGLTSLESYFERVKYKGRGYEEQDLRVILKTYEYWCHRLFPKLPFDQCIAKIETLGTKRPIMTHLKKIRMNMLTDDAVPTSNEFVPDDVSDNEEDDLLPPQPLPVARPPIELSEEQLEMIRLNKERAERIRREKLMQKQSSQNSIPTEAESSQPPSELPTDSPAPLSQNSVINSQSDSAQEFSSQVSIQSHTEDEILSKTGTSQKESSQEATESQAEVEQMLECQEQSPELIVDSHEANEAENSQSEAEASLDQNRISSSILESSKDVVNDGKNVPAISMEVD